MTQNMFSDVTAVVSSLSPATVYAAGLLRSLGAHVEQCVHAPRSTDTDDTLIQTYLEHVDQIDTRVGDYRVDLEITNQNNAHGPEIAQARLSLDDPKGTEYNEFARSCLGGAATYTYRNDGTPVYGFGDRYAYLAAIYGLTAVLGQMYRQNGKTQDVHVDLIQMVTSLLPYPTVQYEYNGSETTSAQSGPRYVTRTIDGYIVIYAGFDWPSIAKLLGTYTPQPESKFKNIDARFENSAELGAAFERWAGEKNTAEALVAGRDANVAIAKIAEPSDVATQYPWNSERPVHIPFRIVGEGRKWEPPSASAFPDGRPLDGVRILDFTQVWSGPYATRILTELGADVVKVESPSRPDWLRKLGPSNRYPDFEPGQDYENRNAWFNTQNRGKRAVSIDFKSTNGRHLVNDLSRAADIVVSNTRPGVMERLSLARNDLWQSGANCNVIQMPGFASNGPGAGDMALGAQYDAFSSAAFFTGTPDEPLLTGFALGDPVAGAFAALAMVGSLYQRRRSGRAVALELAQAEAMISIMPEFLHGDITVNRSNGNEDRRAEQEIKCEDGKPVAIRTVGPHTMSYPIRCPSELMSAPETRGFFDQVHQPSCGTHRYPGSPATIGGERLELLKPAPARGEHTYEVLSSWLDIDPNDLDVLADIEVINQSHVHEGVCNEG